MLVNDNGNIIRAMHVILIFWNGVRPGLLKIYV
jgi:hypothetical protein